jgi:hypothetical protein
MVKGQEMTSKEIIRRVLEFDNPPRVGYNFNAPEPSDFAGCGVYPIKTPDDSYKKWGRYPELLAQVPGFAGEVMRTDGNIYGRLNEKTSGECIRAFLEDGWEKLDEYIETYLDPMRREANIGVEKIQSFTKNNSEKFTMASIISLQAAARDARRLENMLADTILEKENLKRLVDACTDVAVYQADVLSRCGVNGVIIYDDWGLQDRLYLQPEIWREIWKDAYARLIDYLHSRGMKFFLHSCGMIRSIIDDLVEIGVDVFQFDQPAIYDYDDLSRVMYGKATLYSPADIQRVLPTGNKEFIQAEAKRMMDAFSHGGGFIAEDYGNYQAINIKDEWASYAREVFTGGVKEKAVCP